jgi:hypothetical protein
MLLDQPMVSYAQRANSVWKLTQSTARYRYLQRTERLLVLCTLTKRDMF